VAQLADTFSIIYKEPNKTFKKEVKQHGKSKESEVGQNRCPEIRKTESVSENHTPQETRKETIPPKVKIVSFQNRAILMVSEMAPLVF